MRDLIIPEGIQIIEQYLFWITHKSRLALYMA